MGRHASPEVSAATGGSVGRHRPLDDDEGEPDGQALGWPASPPEPETRPPSAPLGWPATALARGRVCSRLLGGRYQAATVVLATSMIAAITIRGLSLLRR